MQKTIYVICSQYTPTTHQWISYELTPSIRLWLLVCGFMLCLNWNQQEHLLPDIIWLCQLPAAITGTHGELIGCRLLKQMSVVTTQAWDWISECEQPKVPCASSNRSSHKSDHHLKITICNHHSYSEQALLSSASWSHKHIAALKCFFISCWGFLTLPEVWKVERWRCDNKQLERKSYCYCRRTVILGIRLITFRDYLYWKTSF